MDSNLDVQPSRPLLPGQFSLRSLFVVVTLCTMVLSMGLSLIHFIRWRTYSYCVDGAQYSEISHEAIVKLFVPPQARNITAWIQPNKMQITASFSVGEQNFVTWADEKGWPLEEIYNHRIANVSKHADPNDGVTIKNGLWYQWHYDPYDPGTTMRIYAYDRSEGVGYFSQLGD